VTDAEWKELSAGKKTFPFARKPVGSGAFAKGKGRSRASNRHLHKIFDITTVSVYIVVGDGCIGSAIN